MGKFKAGDEVRCIESDYVLGRHFNPGDEVMVSHNPSLIEGMFRGPDGKHLFEDHWELIERPSES